MDRFLAISYSLKYNNFVTLNKMYLTIAAVWITALTVSFLPLVGAGAKTVEINRVQHLCRFADILEETYLVLYFVFICATPTVVITAAYFKIFLLARSQERRIASLMVYCEDNLQQPSLRKHSSRQILFNRESKAVKTIGKVVKYLDWSDLLFHECFFKIELYIPKNEALLINRSENPFHKNISF